ncbi:NXPE family member 3-like [Ylistrum balloti]|uniref:NXPE family member 3-like n=1 Tax=Ylistrum balloti TaxID=509963 RepID=UPI0029059B17|nr:NXPE family member 3-like [Ylistrum balloti]
MKKLYFKIRALFVSTAIVTILIWPWVIPSLKTNSLPDEGQQMTTQSHTERLDSYLDMNVTTASHFISPELTTVTVLPLVIPLRVGDTFRVRIRLFYTDGKPVNTGGDYLRIWLKDPSIKNTNVNGHVVDHGNGTYTGEVLLPWKGYPEVYISIANSRHHISLFLSYLEKHGMLNPMASKFIDSTGKHEEESMCSPKPDVALQGCDFVNRCNSTSYNYGLPWFCCKPESEFLTCDDIKTQDSTRSSNIGEFAINVFKNQKHMKIGSMKLDVLEGEDGRELMFSPQLECKVRAPGATWHDSVPTGYYYNKVWINFKCLHEEMNFDICLKDKRVVILGDSNSRGIYQVMCERTNAVELTNDYTKDKPWHKLLMAKNSKLNLDLMWAPHNPPFYVGRHQSLDTMRSVGNWLDRTPHDKPIIVIIHLYYHLTRTTLSVFRALVKDARAGVDRLLARAPDSQIIIQGPHSFTYKDVLEPIDYLRRCHEEIWFQEFNGIHDKVFYVGHWDRTAGMANVNVHPDDYVTKDLVNEMLSYICDSYQSK